MAENKFLNAAALVQAEQGRQLFGQIAQPATAPNWTKTRQVRPSATSPCTGTNNG
ncbi:MAG: hypothetical protein IPL65_09585 [Lewinellaceae bacterium]|nr:hypothetical protein [Lewinellaceae bacterium]